MEELFDGCQLVTLSSNGSGCGLYTEECVRAGNISLDVITSYLVPFFSAGVPGALSQYCGTGHGQDQCARVCREHWLHRQGDGSLQTAFEY